MSATIFDVAELSGYSKATVSRAFVNPERVSKQAKEKIYFAANRLNYTPNAIAQAMVRKRTNNIGFVIYEKQYAVVTNPFYSTIFESVLQTCSQKGYSLFISSDRGLRMPNGQVYVKKQVDGIILAGQSDEQMVLDLQRQGMPVVLLNNSMDMDNLVCVTADQYTGSLMAMQHLLDRGHRHIGLLAGKFSPHVCAGRNKGYYDVLLGAGIPVDNQNIQIVEPTIEMAIEGANALLTLPDPPTALYCTSDVIGIGAIKAALRLGLRVPEDVAIIGFDNDQNSCIVEPELTTIHVQRAEMGRIAAEKLIAQIECELPKKELIQTPVELLVRCST